MFSSSLLLFLWAKIHSLTKQVMSLDIQKQLDWFLEETSLFTTAQPANFPLSFDDLIENPENEKAKNQEGNLNVPYISNIWDEGGWMDEKTDLSILDNQNEWLIPPNDPEKLMVEEAALTLDSFIDTQFDSNGFLSFQVSPENENCISGSENVIPEVDLNFCIERDATSFESSVNVETPYSPVSISSPVSSIQSPIYTSDVQSPVYNSDDNVSDNSFCQEDSGFSTKESDIFITVPQFSYSVVNSSDPVVTKPNRRKAKSSTLSAAKTSSSPYVVPTQSKKEYRFERKKQQNKEAAARYRIKKRAQDQVLSDEVASLEAEQKKLQEKHDGLKNEIKYLKSLMREMFKAKGLLK